MRLSFPRNITKNYRDKRTSHSLHILYLSLMGAFGVVSKRGEKVLLGILFFPIILGSGLYIYVSVCMQYYHTRAYSTDIWDKAEIQSAVCEQQYCNHTGKYWKITIQVKNSNNDQIGLSQAFIDEEPVASHNMSIPVEGQVVTDMTESYQISPDKTGNVVFYIDGDYGNLTSGERVIIRIRSLSGFDYMRLVELT